MRVLYSTYRQIGRVDAAVIKHAVLIVGPVYGEIIKAATGDKEGQKLTCPNRLTRLKLSISQIGRVPPDVGPGP